MKRGKKLLILAVALLVVAGGAFAALEFIPDEEAEVTESEVIYSLDAATLTNLSWTFEDETVSFDYNGEDWTYSEDTSFPLDPTRLNTMLSTLEEVSASRTIENAEDLEQYGLDEPVCTITVTTDTETVISIGDETSLDGLRYVSLGDDNVYLVDSGIYSNFSYGLYDLVSKESIPDMSDLVSFTVERSSGALSIDYLEDSGLAYSDRYTYFAVDDGEYTALDNTLAGDFISQISGLTWGDCVDYKAEAKTLLDYGLDSPAVTVTVNYIETTQVETNETDEDGEPIYETREEEKSFVLEIGDYAEDGCYARIAGSDMVYLIDASICDSLLYTEVSELLPDDVILLDWDLTEGFDITLDGVTYSVTMALEESTDDEGSTTYDYVFTLDGEDVDFSDVLSSLEALESEGSAEGVTPELGEEISFVFHRSTDTFTEVTLTIYKYDSSKCIASLSEGQPQFVSRDAVVDIVEAVTALVLPSE